MEYEGGYRVDSRVKDGAGFEMRVSAPNGKAIYTGYAGLLQNGYDTAEAVIKLHRRWMATAEALGVDTKAMADAMVRGVAL